MLRLSPRQVMFYICSIGSFFFLVINVHLRNHGQIRTGLMGDWVVVPEKLIIDKRSVGEYKAIDPLNPKTKPWYMQDGELRPVNCKTNMTSGDRIATILPEEKPGDDRLIDQLMYVPPVGFVPDNMEDTDIELKKILFWNGASGWGVKPGRGVFIKEKCPVSSCALVTNRKEVHKSDLVLFKDHFTMPGFDRPPEQLWMMFMLESPLHTQLFKHKSVFNWTATYRSDSTLVTPYERWAYYDDSIKTKPQHINFAANKTKKVAWFVSNCGAKNGRLEYARKLSQYIDVDIYGQCGSMNCPRGNKDCISRLDKDYKFYLAFENSNCIDYITEKFFTNGLRHNVLPIAMGARREDYERSAPFNSFIHVDDYEDPEDLAKYLHILDKDDTLYNSHFTWKGTGEMINTKFFCRLCALLHDPKERQTEHKYVHDINDWWRGRTCVKGSWNSIRKKKEKKEGQI